MREQKQPETERKPHQEKPQSAKASTGKPEPGSTATVNKDKDQREKAELWE